MDILCLHHTMQSTFKKNLLAIPASLDIMKVDSEAVRTRIQLRAKLRSNSSEDSVKGNPAGPGGSSRSKPTWSKSHGCSATSAFLFRPRLWSPRRYRMEKPDLTRACPIARAERPRGVNRQAPVSDV